VDIFKQRTAIEAARVFYNANLYATLPHLRKRSTLLELFLEPMNYDLTFLNHP
jgi:hypothetical protein